MPILISLKKLMFNRGTVYMGHCWGDITSVYQLAWGKGSNFLIFQWRMELSLRFNVFTKLCAIT